MSSIKGGICRCKDCEEKRANEQKHLEHPFYKKVDDITEQVAVEQIIKGANTYDEPFNPASWTNKELLWHTLQELRDAQVYAVGLYEKMEQNNEGYKNLLKDYRALQRKYEELERKHNYMGGFVQTVSMGILTKKLVSAEYVQNEAKDVLELMKVDDIDKALLERRKSKKDIGKGAVIDARV